jgi:hypothetical protein
MANPKSFTGQAARHSVGPSTSVPKPPPGQNPLDRISKSITATPAGTEAPYVLRDKNTSTFFTDNGIVFAARGRLSPGGGESEARVYALNWGLVDSRQVAPRPDGERSERVSQYLGNREDRWTTDQKAYSSVVYDELRPGVDLIVESRVQGVKYTLQLAPGADASSLRFRYEGGQGISVSPGGNSVEVQTAIGTLKEEGLLCYQEGPEGRRLIDAHYKIAGPSEYEIVLGDFDPDLPLTLDPQITWSTFLGGALSPYGEDDGSSIAVDSSGNTFVAGYTYCTDFPTPGGYKTVLGGNLDGFLIKLSPTGSVLWGTYIGGSKDDQCFAVTVDASGNAYITGSTTSPDFPTSVTAYQPLYKNNNDAFVMKFNSAGALVWSTLLGGAGDDYGQAIAVDSTGNVYVGGYTFSSDFPTPGGFQPAPGASLPDGFVSKLNSTGTTLLWSSYLGGNGFDQVLGIAVDSTGAVYATGYTTSSLNFPTNGGIHTAINLGAVTSGTPSDGFLTKIAPAGSSILWSTYLGGSGNDQCNGVCISSDGTQDPVVVGTTYSSDFGTFPLGAWRSGKANANYSEAFVTRILSSGTAMVYSTEVGGQYGDFGTSIAAGAAGQVFICGYTDSNDLFVTNGSVVQSGWTGFVSCLNPTGTTVVSETYLGGNNSAYMRGIAVVPSGTGAGVYVAGTTYSSNYPVPAPASRPNPTLGGTLDAFATMLPLSLASPSWSTFIGGKTSLSQTYGFGVTVDTLDTSGNTIYVVGYTTALDYPTAGTGMLSTALKGQTDAYISKITMSGSSPSILWSTYVGGSSDDYAFSVAMDRDGFVYFTGYTYSSDYPIFNPNPASDVWPGFTGGADVFVTQLNTNGGLFYSRLLGAPGSSYGRAIAVDFNFNAYITGYTYSSPPSPVTATSFPVTTGASQPIPGSSTPDAFVTKLAVNGDILWSTYLGGNSTDVGMGIAVDYGGTNVYVAGYTYSTDIPGMTNASQGSADGFVASFNTGTGARNWARYLGGANYDIIYAIATDSSPTVPTATVLYVAGYTSSPPAAPLTATSFPASLGALQTTKTDTYDAFVTQLDPPTGNIKWSTYLGGSNTDLAYALAVDGQKNVVVAGGTLSNNFPTKWPLQTGNSGSYDAFVSKIYASGSSLAWSTMLGGSLYDTAFGVAMTPNKSGLVYVTGYTVSPDFPLLNPTLRSTMGGTADAFIVRLDDAVPHAPDYAAAGAGQFRQDGVTPLAVGAWSFEPSIVAKALLNDPNDYKVQLQVEIQPISADFAGTTIYTSPLVNSGSIAAVSVPKLTSPMQYHWRGRTLNSAGLMSGWKSFGGNADLPLPAAPDVGTDTVPPVANITSPASSGTYYTPANSIGISGTVSDDASGVVSVTWSNSANSTSGSATLSPGTWSVSSIPLVPGPNLISIVAMDAAQNSTASSPTQITIFYDNAAPFVNITSNTSDFATKNGSPTLSGTASDDSPIASVTWSNSRGGSGTATFAGGNWSASITGLQPGSNLITITATDSAGLSSTTTRTITYDNVPPTLTIASPANGFDTGLGTVALSGTAGDNLALAPSNPISWINLANTSSNGTTSVSAGNWSVASVTLKPGPNNIQVTAADSVGNQTSAIVMVYYDVTNPNVSITSPTPSPSPPAPLNTYVTGATTVALSGNASDDVRVVSVNWTNTVGGTVTGSGSATMANPNTASSTWTIAAIPLAATPAVNVITVTATDEVSHNSSVATINVQSDSSAPSVVISIPAANPFYTKNGSIPMSGTASDSGSVPTMTCANTTTSQSFAVGTSPLPAPPPNAISWNATPTLQIGPNTISITGTNAGLTQTTATTTVIYDPIPPSVKITGPTTAATYYTGSSLLSLAGTASDNQGVTSITWSTDGIPASGGATGLGPWSVPTINLAVGSQVITVTASDQAGNSTATTLTVVYDATLPSIAITSPTPAPTFVTAASTIPLGGTTSDDTGVATVVWVNAANGTSGVATPSGTSWSVASVPLVAGANPITAIASDFAGNVQIATITVSYDTALPTVKIKGPTATGSYSTNAANVALSGTSSDDISVASVTWSNAAKATAGTAAGTTSWSAAAIELAPGDNLITVTATDQVGNTATDTITVTYDPQPPTVAITAPSSTGTYNTAVTPVNLSGTAGAFIGSSITPVSVTQVAWTNLTTGGSGVATLGSGTWAASVPLTTGSNGIQVVASDGAGNTAVDSITVVYDPAAPLVVITTPTTLPTYVTANSPLVLGGSALDDVGVSSVTWLSDAAVTPSSGAALGASSWSSSIPLAVGTNNITVTATNVVGTTGAARITVTYDPIPPTVAITSPTSTGNFLSTVSPISISGSASDNVQVQSVTWSNTTTGASGSTLGLGAWSVPAITLVEGNNLITVTATDEVGNTGTANLTVSYNNIPPTLAITSVGATAVTPTSPPVATSTRPLTISGTAGDALHLSSVTWTNSLGGGGSATTTGTLTAVTWSTPVYFFPGDNVITVTATDDHGLTTTAAVTVTFTPVSNAPTLVITSPNSSGSYDSIAQTFILSGSADDVDPIVSVTWLNQATGVRGAAVLTPILGSPTGVLWSANIPLANGANVIVVTAMDDAGNTTPSNFTANYQSISDAINPAISITGPSISGVYNASASPVLVTMAATDNVGVASVTWSNPATGGNGTAVWQSGTTWTVDIAMAVGANPLTFTAFDPSGNHASADLVVNFVPTPGDAIAPVVTIVSPSTSGTDNVSDSLLVMSGTSSDNVQVATVVWSNAADLSSGTADGTTNWTTAVVLQPGLNVITVHAFDTSGNTAKDQVTVFYTPPPPPPVHIAAGACGLLGLEVLFPVVGLWFVHRKRRYRGKGIIR